MSKQQPELTERQLAIIRHTLGIRDGKPRYRVHGPGYRNHFCTGEGSKDFADCEALVAAGVMERHFREYSPGYVYAVVSPQDYLPKSK